MARSRGIRIPEVIIVGAGRDGDEGRGQRTFGAAAESIRERHKDASSKLFGSGDMWYAGDSQMKVPLCHSSYYTSRALLYAALWAVDTPHAMLFSTPR